MMGAKFNRLACTATLAAVLMAMSSAEAAESRSRAQISADPDIAFVERLESYRPAGRVSGTITIWGHGSFKRDMVGELLNGWIAEFQRHHPDVRFENRMYGTASAIGALATGAGNLAILGEEISPVAERTFFRAKGYKPTGFEIATGSLDVNFYDFAHMIFVHKDNPIRQLSLPQLRAIFAARPGAGMAPIRTWGDLGLTGEWADKAIQPYSWKTDIDFGLFFRERVLGDDHRWNPAVREFVHVNRPDSTQYDQGQQIVDALGRDRYGIAISNVRFPNPDVRPLLLGWKDGGPFVAASDATLISQTYPLVRIIPAYIDHAPGKPIDPALREFLRFILSREGQIGLLEHSAYLPIGPAARERELARLK
jgi:phosphate transport system substrate-binding protein